MLGHAGLQTHRGPGLGGPGGRIRQGRASASELKSGIHGVAWASQIAQHRQLSLISTHGTVSHYQPLSNELNLAQMEDVPLGPFSPGTTRSPIRRIVTPALIVMPEAAGPLL